MALLAALFGLALAVALAFCLPMWASAGAVGVLVGVLILAGERFLLYGLAGAALVAFAGWLWRRHEARRSLELPEAPQSSTIARPKTRAKAAEKPGRRVA
jgi:hypothetical protein